LLHSSLNTTWSGHDEEKSEMNFTKLMGQVLVAICLGIFALSALAGNCDNPRYAAKNPLECSDPPTDPPGHTKRLKVTVYYGDELTAAPGDCEAEENKEKCISTSFEVEGTVTCSSQVCDFSRTNEEYGFLTQGEVFGIPPSQFNLLALTSIRGTDIVPAYCFATQYDDGIGVFDPDNPPTTFEQYDYPGFTLRYINGFWLRSPVVSTADDEQKWWAHVWAVSEDMNGVPRQYRFNFGGECNNLDGSRCPTLRDNDFSGDFENGFAGGVFGENTNPRGEGQTCRCTVSSKPGCPDHVNMGDGVPRPASWITIVDVTPE
jgi:hypothetical protein